MTFWEILFILYGLINVISCILIPINCVSTAEDEFWDILIFPKLIRWLREGLNIIGTIIVTILFALFFLPALIVDFAIYSIMFVALLISYLFVEIFKRRD